MKAIDIVGSVVADKKSVLELGCGNGKFISLVAEKYPHLDTVMAVDVRKPENLHSKVTFLQQDFENLALDRKFDLIVMIHAFEHVKNPLGLIEYLKTILNQHGRILIIVPNRNGYCNEARVYFPEHGKHYFLWDKESLEYSLERVGCRSRFYALNKIGDHRGFLRYIPYLLRMENPELLCLAMPE